MYISLLRKHITTEKKAEFILLIVMLIYTWVEIITLRRRVLSLKSHFTRVYSHYNKVKPGTNPICGYVYMPHVYMVGDII